MIELTLAVDSSADLSATITAVLAAVSGVTGVSLSGVDASAVSVLSTDSGGGDD